MSNILQLRVTLNDSHPPIWRRIQVTDDSTFFDLHNAIQDSMGWEDYHLHNFVFEANRSEHPIIIGPQDEEMPKNWLGKKFQKCRYTYDYGDDWNHTVALEKVLPIEPNVKYPRCVAG